MKRVVAQDTKGEGKRVAEEERSAEERRGEERSGQERRGRRREEKKGEERRGEEKRGQGGNSRRETKAGRGQGETTP